MLKLSGVIVPIFFIENCTDAFKTFFMNKKYGNFSIIKKLRKPFLITAWAVSCGGSKDNYDINSMVVMSDKEGLKRNDFHKKEYTFSPSPAPIFHFNSDVNEIIIWLWRKQCQTLKNFYNFTYFFQILGSKIRFPENSEKYSYGKSLIWIFLY